MKPIKSLQQMGFTLLEMLLALGLMAMLMLAMTQLMSQGAEVWNNSDRDIRAVENDKIALDFLRKMLQRAKPIDWKDADEEGRRGKIFVGKKNELFFAAPLPAQGAEQLGVYLFSVSAQKTKEYVNKAMVVKYWPLDENSLDETLEKPVASEVIMTDVNEISWSYFGDKDYSNGVNDPIWQDNWEKVRDFPLAVKLSIRRSKFDPEDPDMAERMSWDGVVFTILQRRLR